MDGLVVTPTTFISSIMAFRVPELIRSRERSSSQMETPASERAWVFGLDIASSLGVVDLCERVAGGLDNSLGRDTEFAEQGLVVGGGTVVLQRHAAAGVADQAVPALRDAGLHGDPGLDAGGKHGLAVGGVLAGEPLEAGHGNHAGGNAVRLQRFARL